MKFAVQLLFLSPSDSSPSFKEPEPEPWRRFLHIGRADQTVAQLFRELDEICKKQYIEPADWE